MKKKEMLSKIENLVEHVENLYKLNDKLVRDMEEIQDKLNYLLNPNKSCKLCLLKYYGYNSGVYLCASYLNDNNYQKINQLKVAALPHLNNLDESILKDIEKEILKEFSVKENKKYVSIYYKTEHICYIITKENCQVSTVTLDVANYLLSKEN